MAKSPADSGKLNTQAKYLDRSRDWFARTAALTVLLIVLTSLIEHALGRRWISASGTIRLWVGSLHSSDLSQQLADWYSFTHIEHGFALSGLLWLISRNRRSIHARWLLAVAAECGWEILENSSIVIDRYRRTAAQGYIGDSVLNSVSDVAFCLIGFGLAARLPVRITIAVSAVTELVLACAIRDNLTLNIVMLIHPFSSVRGWQQGSG